jgi:arsenate reductase-like glutaredoxin family protein
MLKRVDLYVYPNNKECEDISEFLREQEVDLRIRNIKDRPLSADEIAQLFRHFDTKHFLNESAASFKTHKLDRSLPPRRELFELMAQDNDLIRMPVIVAGRLMVIGCNISKIKEMLQIRDEEDEPENNNIGRRDFSNGRNGKNGAS